jgi:hypothetical protein
MGAKEIEAIIGSDVWRVAPLAGDALNVTLAATEKALQWPRAASGRLAKEAVRTPSTVGRPDWLD